MSLPGESSYDSPGLLAIHHVVVPAAVIAMVASLLFYLVDIRSAFLGGGPQLKWIGFCFALATVLIERYGRTTGESEFQGCYTLALTGATAVVMLIAPWDTGAPRLEERLANLLIVAVVWRFATRVTRGLSPESGERRAQVAAFYGLDRLTLEAWQQKQAEEKGVASPRVKPPSPLPKNPAASVARLAGVALAAFALGEPVLLRAAPQTGVRALAAVIVFLFSTGLVMAAGASMDALRRVERAGGRTDPSFLPRRLAFAAGFLILLLAAGLGLPGLEFRGSGLLRPPNASGQGDEQDRGYQRSDQTKQVPPGEAPPDQEGPEGQPGPGLQPSPPLGIGGLTGPAASLLRTLAALGKVLIVPLVLVLLTFGIWKLVHLWPGLEGWWVRLKDRWRSFLQKITAWFLWSREKRNDRRQGPDPLARLEELDSLPPRESVLAAYQRFLLLLDRLGSPRPGKDTPYDLLNHLPQDLRVLEDPVRTLTELYVCVAYSDEPVEHGARERAITALKGIRGLLESPAAG